MTDAHNDVVREQFRIQAGTWNDEGFAARGLDWILQQLAPSAGEPVLDVGAAHLDRWHRTSTTSARWT